MSNLSECRELLRKGDVYGIYPYCSRFGAAVHGKNKNYVHYAGRVYKFKKEGTLREFFAGKIELYKRKVGADMVVSVPSHDCRKKGILQDIFGVIIRRRETVEQAKYHHGRVTSPGDTCELTTDVTGKNVLLVDDVCTTGATITAFRGFLEEAGAVVCGELVCGLTVTKADYIPDEFVNGTAIDEVGEIDAVQLPDDVPVTMAQYARLHGISQAAVLKAVREGRLNSNGNTGRCARVWGKILNARNPQPKSPADREDLAEARLEKLRADIEVQRQKLETTERERRKEIGEIMLEEYHKAFAPMRARIVEMRLGAAKLAMLRKMAEEAAQAFDAAVRRRLDNGD